MIKIKRKKYNWFERITLKFVEEYINKYGDTVYSDYLVRYNPIRMTFVFIGCFFLIRRFNKLTKKKEKLNQRSKNGNYNTNK